MHARRAENQVGIWPLALILATLLLHPLAGRADNADKPSIVGVWLTKTDQVSVESAFGAGCPGGYVCTIKPADGDARVVKGTYKLDGDTLEVTLASGKVSRLTFRLIGGDTLELTDEKGNSTRMERKAVEESPGPRELPGPRTARLTDKTQSPVLGEWVIKNDKFEFHLTLNADGTYERVTKAGGKEDKQHGTFKLDAPRIELTAEDGTKLPFAFRLLDPSNLELTGDDKSLLRLVRVGPPPGPNPGPGSEPGPRTARLTGLGPFYGPNFKFPPRPPDAPMPDYMKGILPDMTAMKKDASGHILYTHGEAVRLVPNLPAIASGKMYIMTGDGQDQAPFIRPKGLDFVWFPAWSPDGKKVLFASSFESARSAQYFDLFQVDLAGGNVRRLTGVEAWAPVKGRGTLTVTVEDTTNGMTPDVSGPGSLSSPNQINIAVQTCDGQLFKVKGERAMPAGRPGEPPFQHRAYSVVIPDCPSGTIWVKAWSNRFIGDLTTMVLPTDGKEECVLHLSGGNFMSSQPQLSPDGRYVLYLAEKTSFELIPYATHGDKWEIHKNPNQGSSTLAVFDVQRGAPVALWEASKFGYAGDGKLSPDGQQMVFTLGIIARQMIAVCSLKSFLEGRPDTKVLVRFQDLASPLEAGGVGNCQPAWSPDGKRIVFVRYLETTKRYQGNLFVVNADGTGLAQLTALVANQLPFWPSWSPDGKRIAFQVRTGKGPLIDPTDLQFNTTTTDIFSTAADGTDFKQLTKDGHSGEPSWGP